MGWGGLGWLLGFGWLGWLGLVFGCWLLVWLVDVAFDLLIWWGGLVGWVLVGCFGWLWLVW